ncbi:hypothetical protein Kkor_2168 [Kangiella koreensis DSM 16069]|uniref:Uncharacterized protein n=1 Tax=Kangiella koreensis (strain DSM 16069 / JCM 12317 / KCTC 12182 / SW-125) TaxID=523791 RepID=C7R7P5_KANKD|nr:hypothetical protein Kkor_2168 [Kangiella koreensis DSM 16069]
MKLKTDIYSGHKIYRKGDQLPWVKVYGLFIIVVFAILPVIFNETYIQRDINLTYFLFLGGFFPLIYLLYYRSVFGRDAILWIFINSILGILGTFAELNWLLKYFYEKEVSDFPFYYHIVPAIHYILLTYVLRQAIIDTFHARDNDKRLFYVNILYVVLSILIYSSLYFIN